jgi:hypothetical protein
MKAPGQQSRPQDWSWPYWFLVPLYPYSKRRTLCTEVVKDTIWTFDQIQGIFYVTVPIRMTVVRLEQGGLLVYSPVAPTLECIRVMNDLEAKHGPVKYIILPTVSGLEHKVFVVPFARRFPQAQIFVTPDQWSYPIRLPLNWLGFPRRRTQVLPRDSATTPFGHEFAYEILGPIDLGLGPFAETVFYHVRSHTLLVTDTVLRVPSEPPEVVQLDPYPLLFHAKDDVFDVVVDSPETRRKGWQRIALFAFYFQPSVLKTVPLGAAIRNAFNAPDRSKKAYFGLFPFKWSAQWQQSFDALHADGRLLVAPILQRLILNRAPQAVLNWVDRVAQWEFERIIPCHLDAVIATTPAEFRQAFDFLDFRSSESRYHALLEDDLELLNNLDRRLSHLGITPPVSDTI